MKANKSPNTMRGYFLIIDRVVKLNAPTPALGRDKREIISELYQIFKLLFPFVTAQEMSRITARYTYNRFKKLGWHKVKINGNSIWRKDQ